MRQGLSISEIWRLVDAYEKENISSVKAAYTVQLHLFKLSVPLLTSRTMEHPELEGTHKDPLSPNPGPVQDTRITPRG